MRSILVLGAGRSATSLIDYLLAHVREFNAGLTVGDVSLRAAQEKVKGDGKAICFDIQKDADQIENHDLIVSLLPPSLHSSVAKKCLQFRKHLITASYVSDEMRSLDADASENNILLLNECGLDPGMDHMSAMRVIDRIRNNGGEMTSFESFTGGLIAPETDPANPWRYKFTWNPRNVVMAGQATAKFLDDGQYKYIPYQQLFKRITAVVIPGIGEYEGYANRDSLVYQKDYGLDHIRTMLRGTLRNKGFCAAWNILVQLGCTDDSYEVMNVAQMTHRDFMNSFLKSSRESAEESICTLFHIKRDGDELERLQWSGLFSDEVIGIPSGTPAQILEHILHKRWKLQPQDRDQIVMWHRFRYVKNDHTHETQSSLAISGEDAVRTAMAKTVGLPMAIAAKLLLQGRIKSRGVKIPVTEEFYEPILRELSDLGIRYRESGHETE